MGKQPTVEKQIWAIHVQENIPFKLLIVLFAYIWVSAQNNIHEPNSKLRNIM
jgi:hypothetical protein